MCKLRLGLTVYAALKFIENIELYNKTMVLSGSEGVWPILQVNMNLNS